VGITVLLFITVLIDNPAKQRWLDQLNHAVRLSEQNKHDAAGEAFTAALQRAEDSGAGEPALALTLGQLAAHQQQIGNLLEAERNYIRALQIFERNCGKDRHDIAQTAIGLAGIYIQTGQLSRAEDLLSETLAEPAGFSDLDIADIEANLAAVLVEQRRFDEAEPIFGRCVAVFEKEQGDEFFQRTVTALSNLGGVYMQTKRLPEADQSFRRAIQMLQRMRRPPAELLAKTVGNAAMLAMLQGSDEEADVLFTNAIDGCKRNLGPEHHILGQLLTGYAQHLRHTGRKADAKRAEKTAAAILEKFNRNNLTGHTVDLQVLRHEAATDGS
jgi:tetratricopeptide (TPR) repeat protein